MSIVAGAINPVNPYVGMTKDDIMKELRELCKDLPKGKPTKDISFFDPYEPITPNVSVEKMFHPYIYAGVKVM